MMAWLLWLFLAMHLFLLEGMLLQFGDWLGSRIWVPDMTVALCLFCAVFARHRALPGLLFCIALGRAVFVDGSLCMHLLVLGVPVAVLLPLRLLFSTRSLIWPCLAAGALTFLVPRMAGLLARLAEAEPPTDTSALRIFVSMCLVPPFVWLLGSVPPLSLFREREP